MLESNRRTTAGISGNRNRARCAGGFAWNDTAPAVRVCSDGHTNSPCGTVYTPILTQFQPVQPPAILPTVPAAAPSAQPPVLFCSHAAGRTSGVFSPFQQTASTPLGLVSISETGNS